MPNASSIAERAAGAVELAQQHGASIVDAQRLSGVGAVPIGGSCAAQVLGEHRVSVTKKRIEKEIAGFEKACAEASVSCIVDGESGDPLQLLLGLWSYHDLTIIGPHGLFEHAVPGGGLHLARPHGRAGPRGRC